MDSADFFLLVLDIKRHSEEQVVFRALDDYIERHLQPLKIFSPRSINEGSTDAQTLVAGYDQALRNSQMRWSGEVVVCLSGSRGFKEAYSRARSDKNSSPTWGSRLCFTDREFPHQLPPTTRYEDFLFINFELRVGEGLPRKLHTRRRDNRFFFRAYEKDPRPHRIDHLTWKRLERDGVNTIAMNRLANLPWATPGPSPIRSRNRRGDGGGGGFNSGV